MLERVSVWGILAREWLGRTGRHFLRPGSIFVALIDATYAISQILREQAVPSSAAWTRHHPLGWLLAVSGGAALVGTLLVFAGFDRMVRRSRQDDDLYEACKGVWRVMVETHHVPMDKIGVSVWEVRGVWGFHFLARRTSFVIRGRRHHPHVVWRKGKGAIGIAWDEDETIIANIENLRVLAANQASFEAIPRRDRFALSWREYRRTRRHSGILAAPIRVRGRVRGVLSVDLQVDGHSSDLDNLGTSDDLAYVLTVCEAVFGGRG